MTLPHLSAGLLYIALPEFGCWGNVCDIATPVCWAVIYCLTCNLAVGEMCATLPHLSVGLIFIALPVIWLLGRCVTLPHLCVGLLYIALRMIWLLGRYCVT